MKIYLDKELTKEVHDLEFGTVEAGTKKQFIFYVYNDSLGELVDLVFSINSKEVKIISAPKQMNPKGISELIIEYNPLVTIETGLKADIIIEGHTLFK